MKTKRWVMVTTKHRGVFMGELLEEKGSSVLLAECRMCVSWNQATRGVVSLAHNGPGDGCRVTFAAPQARLRDITAIFDCTEAATEKWRGEPWS